MLSINNKSIAPAKNFNSSEQTKMTLLSKQMMQFAVEFKSADKARVESALIGFRQMICGPEMDEQVKVGALIASFEYVQCYDIIRIYIVTTNRGI